LPEAFLTSASAVTLPVISMSIDFMWLRNWLLCKNGHLTKCFGTYGSVVIEPKRQVLNGYVLVFYDCPCANERPAAGRASCFLNYPRNSHQSG
jgi:hypothetical protein